MELSEVVLSRRMVRRYDPDRPVPEEVVDRMLRHAVRAPSAGFSQGWDLLVLASAAERELFWSATTAQPAATAQPSSTAQPSATARPSASDGSPAAGVPAASAAAGERWLAGMRTAPLLVVLLSDPGAYRGRYAADDKRADPARRADRDPDAWPVAWWDVDTAMAGLLLLLTAVDEGMGGCLFGVPPARHDAVREAFGVPADRRVVAVVSAGYPAPAPTPPPEPAPDPETGPAPGRGPAAGAAARSSRPARRPLAEVVHRGRFDSSGGSGSSGG